MIFESFGLIPSVHGFTQLGAVLGNLSDGNIIDTFHEYANQSKYIPDNNCINTFWINHPENKQNTLDKCSESTKTPQEVIELFISWIKKHSENRNRLYT